MTEIIVIPTGGELAPGDLLTKAGQAANQAAAAGAFTEYQQRKAINTLKRQRGDLALFAEFLQSAGIPAGDMLTDPGAWRGVTWGLVEAFREWLLQQGYALASVNFALSTVKIYARLATKAGAIEPPALALIQLVTGYAHKEADNINQARAAAGLDTRRRIRRGGAQRASKKAESVSITREQARQLKAQPDTPQGRRDAVIMSLLLDHGLRCSDLSGLQVENINLAEMTLAIRVKKTGKGLKHELTKDTFRAITAYLENDQPMQAGPLLLTTRRAGRKGESAGTLAGLGMTERAITKRVEYLGQLVGIRGLSAHDCRHYAATRYAKTKQVNELMEIFGWSSPAMAVRYIEVSKVVKVESARD